MGVRVREKRAGEWWIFIQHRGRRTSKKVGDRRAAEGLAKDIRTALAAGDLGLLRQEEALTFDEYAGRYLRNAEPLLKRSTWMDYDGVVRLHLTPVFGVRPLHAVSRSDVKTLALNLRRRGLRPKSVRKIVGVLSTILNEAVDDQLIASNAALGLRKVYRSPDFANAGPDARNVNPLTRDDIAHLLATAHAHQVRRGANVVYPFRDFYPFLLLLARTGVRLGEALALQWGDIDWHGGFIEVRRARVRSQVTTTKNKKVRRVDVTAAARSPASTTRHPPAPQRHPARPTRTGRKQKSSATHSGCGAFLSCGGRI